MPRSFNHIALCLQIGLLATTIFVSAPLSALTESPSTQSTPLRIISMAPHLTEWIYLFGREDEVVGVSAYSDYPANALQKPVIADANGINFKALFELSPTLILVWEGGNKSQDIARLETLGFPLFYSSPAQLEDIGQEVLALGTLLSEQARAAQIERQFATELLALRSQYQLKNPLPVLFYMWTKPIMSIGENAWANQALRVCNAHTIFADSPTDYPEVRLTEILLRQPVALITTLNASKTELEQFWRPHRDVLKAPIIKIDGNIFNRFTPRIIDQLHILCDSLHSLRSNPLVFEP